MRKQISATDAKNSFGGLLDDVQALGRVEIMKHGRLVAVVLSPRELETVEAQRQPVGDAQAAERRWGRTHMIPPQAARRARVTKPSRGFGDD